jgi:hypothetical protein
MRHLPLPIAALAVSVLAAQSAAQDTALTRLLIANRHDIRITDGVLAGAGGRFLVDEGRKSRFFLAGEEHGVGQMPQVIQALLAELRPAGYNTLAIEISSLQGERLNAFTGKPGLHAALDSMIAPWLTTIPFYSVAEDRAMLEAAMSPLGAAAPMRVWGLDYEISADRYYLAELESLAPPAGKAAVRRARDVADKGFLSVPIEKNPAKLFAWSATDSMFTALRAAFAPAVPPRAKHIIDVFQRSAEINRLFMTGESYKSNLLRAQFLRENFATALSAAESRGEKPRVLLKFGGNHLMRGMTEVNTLDLGTAATIVAESRGERAFNLLILGGSGSKAARLNILTLQNEATPSGEVDGAAYAWLRPALADTGWSLFDLGAVRAAWLRVRARALSVSQERMVHAFDAILVLTGSGPGTPTPLVVRH